MCDQSDSNLGIWDSILHCVSTNADISSVPSPPNRQAARAWQLQDPSSKLQRVHHDQPHHLDPSLRQAPGAAAEAGDGEGGGDHNAAEDGDRIVSFNPDNAGVWCCGGS